MLFVCLFLFFASNGYSKDFFSKIVLKAEDVKGNRDTVACILTSKEIEEQENLYGIEPKSDLDMRLIQRADTNNNTWWLCCNGFKVPFFFENVDKKNDSRFVYFGYPYLHGNFVLNIYTKNYPVKISIIEWTTNGWINYKDDVYYQYDLRTALYNHNGSNTPFPYSWFSCEHSESKIEIIDNDTIYNMINENSKFPLNELYTFQDETENNLIAINLYHGHYGGVEDNYNNENKLYPNPSKDYVIIENGIEGEIFEVVNIEGKTFNKVTVEKYPYSLDVSKLPNGVYYIYDSKKNNIYKFIKE